MTISLDFAPIKNHISDNILILTPNSRTQKAVFAGQIASISTNDVIESAEVYSLSQWLESLWQELSFYYVLPKRLSNLLIKSWLEETINNEDEWSLTNSSGVADKVLQAYQNLKHWNLSITDVEESDYFGSNDSTEIGYFKQWINRFEKFCKTRHLIANFSIIQFLATHIDDLRSVLPKQILMIGFNQLTPLEKAFLQQLESCGTKVEYYNYSFSPDKSAQIECSSYQQELIFAAEYAQKYSQDDCSIGIVVEQLSSHLTEVHQAFSQTFHPFEEKPWVALTKPQYNVSAGFSLAEQPLVVIGLLLLKTTRKGFSLENLQLLKNTFLIEWGEFESEIKYFIHQQCLLARKNYSLAFLLKRIQESDSSDKLVLLFERLSFIAQASINKARIEQHIEHWKAILEAWQWGIEKDNDTSPQFNEFEAQAKKQFINLIEECFELEKIVGQISSSEAINYLEKSARQTACQIASDRTNVQVLGILEATGLQFDHLILVGFNANNWPQKNKINPFLPLLFQRKHNMPGSSAEREFEYAKDLSSTLLNSAKYLLVTSSDSESNETNNASPFFANLKVFDQTDFIDEKPIDIAASQYQWIEDSPIDLSSQSIRGGAYLLSDYAKCPFMSLTKYQLKLAAYEMPEIGIDARTKGSWLHEAMEIIWKEIETKQQLVSMSDEALKELVESSLRKSLVLHRSYLLAITSEEIIDLELIKLTHLILEWMFIEKDKDDFLVKEFEQDCELSLSGLDLKFRIDRVDLYDNNEIEIIDYKSGSTNYKNWFGVRPTEAQMPAYVLSQQDKNIFGLSYARIKTGEVAQSGLSFINEDNSDKKVLVTERFINNKKVTPIKISSIDSYEKLVIQWEKSLSRIAEGIKSGFMPVSPKDQSQTCNYCDYRSVCRIDEEQPND